MKVFALLCVFAGPVAAADLPVAALDAPESFAGAQVVVLGELHDNPSHHAHQARAVATLRPRALVLEMLTPAQAARMPDLLPDAVTLGRVLEWDGLGWPDFAQYYPIFAAAPSARIYGAHVPREEARRAMQDGLRASFGAAAADFGLDANLAPEEQSAREAEQMQAHCNALPAALLPGMVDVQRLRDATLARAALQALHETGGPVAVITGNGHARRDRGLAAPLAFAAPEVTVLTLGQFEQSAPQNPPYDLWVVTPAVPRDDPCLAFKG